MSTSTRRISVTAEQLQSEPLRAQLFSACCAYGLVEWVQYEEDPNYNTTTVHLQFQKLSSADRLRSDMQQRGQAWQLESEAAVPCVGSDVLLSATEPLDIARFTSLLPSVPCTEPVVATSTSTTSGALTSSAMSTTVKADPPLCTFEEKSYQLQGRGTAAKASAARVTAEQEAALWAGLEQQFAALRHCCLGPFCAVLHIDTPHAANEFLLRHQLSLAERHGIFAVHVGTSPASALAVALPRLLTRHALSGAPVEGRVVRGYVVAMPSNTYCVVDAGLYPSSPQAAATTLVHTHTNFLKVSLGDEVQVQLSAAAGGLTLAGEGMVGAKLVRVLVTSAAAARRPSAKGQQRTSSLARGLQNVTAATSRQGPTPPSSGGPDLAGVLKRAAANAKAGTATPGARPLSGAAAKMLASRLYQKIQQGKLGAEGASAERLCTYPAGLSVYTRLLVRVEAIVEDGLRTRCVDDVENCGYTGPVFVPAALVPSDTVTTSSSNGSTDNMEAGQGWRDYAVVGERMHVALLYMVAVGGSAATMRGVASKTESDLRRAVAATAMGTASIPSSPDYAQEGAEMGDRVVAAGTAVRAVSMLQLSDGDLGVPSASETSASSARATPFPALLLRVGGPHVSAALRQTPLLLPLADLGPLDAASLATSPASLTISEVVNDMARGQYAVVVPCDVYAARQAARAAAQEEKRHADVDEVKRRLAAVMGEDILEVLRDDYNGPVTKRPRTHE